MKSKSTLFEWLTTDFSIHMQNVENFSLKRSFTVNYAKILVFLTVYSLTIALGAVFFVRWIGGYYSSEMRQEKKFRAEIYQLSKAIDSLKLQSAQKDSFILSFKTMLVGGNEVTENEKLKNRSEINIKLPKKEDKLNEAEKKLRALFNGEISVQDKNSGSGERDLNKIQLSGVYFFPPIEGLVSNQFNKAEKHLGVDIVGSENEPIKSVLDGSVIYSGWSYDTGYMLVVQHNEDLISIYKHNATLFKKAGEDVKTGEVVAIMGNSGELSSGAHLHFEMWYKGHPLNPSEYIVF